MSALAKWWLGELVVVLGAGVFLWVDVTATDLVLLVVAYILIRLGDKLQLQHHLEEDRQMMAYQSKGEEG